VVLGRSHYQGRCPWLTYSAPSGRVWIYGLEGLPIARNIPLGYLIFAPLGCICPKGKNRAAPCRARGARDTHRFISCL